MVNRSVSSGASVRSPPPSSSSPESLVGRRQSTSTQSSRRAPVASVIASNHDYHFKRSSVNGATNISPDLCDRITIEAQNEPPAAGKTISDRRNLLPPRLESIPSTESEYASLGNYNKDTELLVHENSMEEEDGTSITMQPVITFAHSPQHSLESQEDRGKYSRSLYFEDGERVIDFVIVYMKGKDEKASKETRKLLRRQFTESLLEEGLQMEWVKSNDAGLKFIKLHAPWDVLICYAEIMKLKMPMKQIETSWRLVFDDEDPYSKENFTATFSRDKMYLFQIPAKKELFFSSAIRSQIVDFIMKRKTFTANVTESGNLGIHKLLQDGVLLACYPLHEGKLNDDLSSSSMLFPNEEANNNDADNSGAKNEGRSYKISPRLKLVKDWASLRNTFKKQPLDEIRRYFGVKISLYFAWLGFYTSMLVPPSIVGVLCFCYGWFTLQYDVSVQEICSESLDKYTMCPLCSVKCNFWKMSDTCNYAKLAYLFDNPGTVFFAVFMSFWATVYLEMWKRYSARITYRWDLSDLDEAEEYPRPEFLARLSKGGKKRLNIITKMYEPYVPFWSKQFPNMLLSGSTVFFLVLVALASVLGVIVYRVVLRNVLSKSHDQAIADNSTLITSATAAALNLVCIMIFNIVYGRLAYALTEMEMPRNQSDFDNSLTLKMYLLQFVNYYSSIFYIAFFKGRFAATPKDMLDDGSFAGQTQEECGTGGCLPELAIQLAIIMVGKQTFSGFMEFTTPWLKWCVHKWRMRNRIEEGASMPQWENDLLLTEWGSQSLFSEYLEMVLQFGFVTIFVAAFPLAPLFALINNALEIRLDGIKIITAFRRPVARRVKSIGIWYGILDSIGKLSVLTNAVIIAFTSDFIPRTMYYSKHRTMSGYINSTLSAFNISDLTKMYHNATEIVEMNRHGIHVCMYQGNRNPPQDAHPYEPNYDYWETLAMKLVFVLVFENVLTVTKMILCWLIPDVPGTLTQNIRQHAYLTNELIMQQELARAKDT